MRRDPVPSAQGRLWVVAAWRMLALQVIVGAVCLVGALAVVHHYGSQHSGEAIPRALLPIAVVEIVAVVMFWIPAVRHVGGWLLIGVLVAAAGLHVWMNEGVPREVFVYIAAVVAAMQPRRLETGAERGQGDD